MEYTPIFKEKRKPEDVNIVTNRLDLQTLLGSQPVMPKNFPGHWPCPNDGLG